MAQKALYHSNILTAQLSDISPFWEHKQSYHYHIGLGCQRGDLNMHFDCQAKINHHKYSDIGPPPLKA